MQLVLQHCCRTSWIAMLCVLPPMSNLSCDKSGCRQVWAWVVKHATSLFNLFCSNVARQVARFLLPVFPYLKGLGAVCSHPTNTYFKKCSLEGLSNALFAVFSLDPLYIPLESYYEWMVIHWHRDQDLIQQFVTKGARCVRFLCAAAPFQEVLLILWSTY